MLSCPATGTQRTEAMRGVLRLVIVQLDESRASAIRETRCAPPPLTAVRQMGAHRRPRRLAVLAGDGVEDRAVLGVDATQIGLAFVRRGVRRVEPGARNDGGAEGQHEAFEVRVLRRPGDLE